MTTETVRGSAKLAERLFASSTPGHEDLAQAISVAKESYKIERWWKYGQPAIDLIKGSLKVNVKEAGALIQQIIDVQNEAVQVSLDVFPLGIPFPDVVRVNVTFERTVR